MELLSLPLNMGKKNVFDLCIEINTRLGFTCIEDTFMIWPVCVRVCVQAESGYLYTCCEHYPHFRSSLQLATASSDQSHATQESTEHVQNQES